MQSVPRVMLVIACVVAAAASASAPQSRKVNTTASVTAPYEQTWEAVIDLFSERNWAIQNMDRDSGLITTDWMSLGSEAKTFADCGGSGLATVRETAVRFNVRVKPADDETSVAVNATFRQQRVFDNNSFIVDCTSMGAVEALIHREVEQRSAHATPRPTKPVPAAAEPARPRGFYCASSPTTPAAGLCTRDKADCARAREAAAGVVADLAECALTETAHCFDAKPGDERCVPSAEACAAQRERLGGSGECRPAT